MADAPHARAGADAPRASEHDGPTTRPDAADVRELLVRAASTLLAEEGPEALTVRRIAAEAGVSTMGVYSRFGGKDGVVDALYREGFEGLLAAFDDVAETDDPLADLGRACAAYRRFALTHATHYRVMFSGAVPGFAPSDESVAVAAASFERVAGFVRRCVEAGILGGDGPYEIAASLWATSHGLVSLELLGKKPEVLADDEPYERTTAAVIRGFLLGGRDAPPTGGPVGPMSR